MICASNKVDQAINWVCPVDWLCPLTRGLVSWWLCVPGASGGSKWPDLCRNSAGTLTNMDPATDWVPQSHQGGFGALDFDGTNDKVAFPVLTFAAGVGVTISMWTKDVATGINRWFGGTNNGRIISVTTTLVRCIGADVGVPTMGLNWKHITATRDVSSKWNVYVNGISNSAGTVDSTTFIPQGFATDGGGFFTVSLNDLAIFNRALSASEAYALYQDSRLGHPQMLSRIRRPMTFEGAAAASTFKPWYLDEVAA